MNIAGSNTLTIYPISESAVTVEFGNTISEQLMERVLGLEQLLLEKPFQGMYQAVPAYTTLSVFFDPVIVARASLPGKSCYDKVYQYLQTLGAEYEPMPTTGEAEAITIPVSYGGRFGHDLEYLAGYHQLSIDEVISLHSSAVYKVYMIGFVPGFAYMGGLADILETPRKATPVRVNAGAVGIAGKQTGVYPLEIPGGWQIIGQTPVKLFDAGRAHPALLKAGDRVKFEPISSVDFDKYGGR